MSLFWIISHLPFGARSDHDFLCHAFPINAKSTHFKILPRYCSNDCLPIYNVMRCETGPQQLLIIGNRLFMDSHSQLSGAVFNSN